MMVQLRQRDSGGGGSWMGVVNCARGHRRTRVGDVDISIGVYPALMSVAQTHKRKKTNRAVSVQTKGLAGGRHARVDPVGY